MTTETSIINRLISGTRGSVTEYYTMGEIRSFAKSYTAHWDEYTSENVISESFVDDMWNTQKPCHRCTECGCIMREGYFEPDGFDYMGSSGGACYCSDECLNLNFTPAELQKAMQNDEVYYTNWY